MADDFQTEVNDHAAEFLLGNLINASTNRFKFLATPFSQLKEHEKKTLLNDLRDDIEKVVKDAVAIIASNARLTFRASVDQVVFKDGVKAVLTMTKSEEAHALADVEGSYVTVVIEDISTLLDEGDSLAVEKDQKELL